jgi:hypothetical protein
MCHSRTSLVKFLGGKLALRPWQPARRPPCRSVPNAIDPHIGRKLNMSKRKYLVPDDEPPEVNPEDEEYFLQPQEEEPEMEGGFFVGDEVEIPTVNSER